MTRAVLLIVFVAAFALAPWISPHDPLQQYREHAASAPGCSDPCFPLGTDDLGRDVLSRTLHGGRLSLSAGLMASVLALFAGGLLGALAASSARWLDQLLSRAVDLLFALPWLYLLLAARAAMPLSLPTERAYLLSMCALGLAGIGAPYRVARQAVRAARAGEPVRAAIGLGASPAYLLRAHLVPAAAPALLALWASLLPAFVLIEVALSFLGLGVGEPTVTWGTVLAPLRQYSTLVSQWWMFSPALALALFLALIPRSRPAPEAAT